MKALSPLVVCWVLLFAAFSLYQNDRGNHSKPSIPGVAAGESVPIQNLQVLVEEVFNVAASPSGERTPGPSCPQTPAWGLGAWSGWSYNQYTLTR